MHVSRRKQRVSAKVSRIFRDKKERNGSRCFISKRNYMLTPAHLIRQSYSLKLQDDERNIIPLNLEIHDMFDNGRLKELYEKYPYKVKAIVDRMFDLDFYYTQRFLSRNNLEKLRR